jgi:hypothetical protein
LEMPICLGDLEPWTSLILASQLARITGMNHWYLE